MSRETILPSIFPIYVNELTTREAQTPIPVFINTTVVSGSSTSNPIQLLLTQGVG